MYKLKEVLPSQYYQLFKSYLFNRLLIVKQENELSNVYEIQAGVPQGNIFGLLFYDLYTADSPVNENMTVWTYADNATILQVDKNH